MLDAIRLFRQEIIAVAAPALIAGHRLPLDPDTLSRLPKLHDAHDLWPAFLRELEVEDRGGRGLRLNQTTLAMDAALSGQGAALVSSFLAKRDIAANHLIQLLPHALPGKQDFYLLAVRGPKRSSSTQAVIEWFASKAESDA